MIGHATNGPDSGSAPTAAPTTSGSLRPKSDHAADGDPGDAVLGAA